MRTGEVSGLNFHFGVDCAFKPTRPFRTRDLACNLHGCPNLLLLGTGKSSNTNLPAPCELWIRCNAVIRHTHQHTCPLAAKVMCQFAPCMERPGVVPSEAWPPKPRPTRSVHSRSTRTDRYVPRLEREEISPCAYAYESLSWL